MCRAAFTIGLFGWLTLPSIVFAAEPRVDIEVGDTSPVLTRRAADELAADLKRLYGADVHVGAVAPAEAINVIRILSRNSDDRVQELPDNWLKRILDRLPKSKISKQAQLVATLKHRDRPALLVFGGSPAGSYWASTELTHRLGSRSMLYGDVEPVAPPQFSLEGFQIVKEPQIEIRAWQMDFDSPIGPASWRLAEQRKLLRQLARLKFNAIILSTTATSPADAVVALRRISVSGDTAGRSAFGGAKFFENPDLAAAKTDEARRKVADELIRGIESEAKALGMTIEFVKAGEKPPLLVDASGLLPHLAPALLQAELNEKASTKQGAAIQIASVGDADLAAYLISRASFDAKVTNDQAVHDLVTPICGEGVSDRVLKAFQLAEEATKLIDAGDKALSAPAPDVVMKHYASTDPPPEWWGKVRDNYLNAMNEMYRANTRAREGGRSYTLYFARRFEFAFETMNCLEAVRKAGIAKSKGDAETQVAELEKAVESMNGALNAMAAVARSQSDRGIIAVLNEYGYRPLMKELDAVSASQ